MRFKTRCWCRRCDEAERDSMLQEHHNPVFALASTLRMNLCPDCGNKRCPKATQHDLPCGNSNLPGQPGSDYGAPAPLDAFIGPSMIELLRDQECQA